MSLPHKPLQLHSVLVVGWVTTSEQTTSKQTTSKNNNPIKDQRSNHKRSTIPEESENLRSLERVKTHLVSALHKVYDFVRAGVCDGIITLYTERYTRSAFLYRYRLYL
jgi:hypothetical protein